MPSDRYPGFIGQSYTSLSPIADCAELINWYIEAMEDPGAKSGAVFYPTPGFTTFATVAQIGGRAIFSTASDNSRCFAVMGSHLYEVFIDGSTIDRSALAIDASSATICTSGDGGQELFITSGGNGYTYNLTTNVVTQIAALNGKATQGAFLDGYFLAFDRTTGTVYLSDLYDGLTWDPTQFFTRSSRSDTWNAMWVTAWGQIFLPGTKTRDYWYNAGTSPIPFVPTQSGTQPDGIAATFSISENSGNLCWLQTNEDGGYQIFSSAGYRGERISTHAVEQAIANYSTVTDAIGETYTDQGHQFYLLTFPSGETTWVYDFSTKGWHKRLTWHPDLGIYHQWHAQFHCFAFNKHLWVDSASGVIAESRDDLTTDIDGSVIRRQRTAPSICRGHEVLSVGTLELLMQTGIGNANDPGSDPQILLQVSRDGGRTFGSERTASAGAIGTDLTRVKWERNGSARDWAAQVVCSDPVTPWAIIDCFVNISDRRGQPVSLGGR